MIFRWHDGLEREHLSAELASKTLRGKKLVSDLHVRTIFRKKSANGMWVDSKQHQLTFLKLRHSTQLEIMAHLKWLFLLSTIFFQSMAKSAKKIFPGEKKVSKFVFKKGLGDFFVTRTCGFEIYFWIKNHKYLAFQYSAFHQILSLDK